MCLSFSAFSSMTSVSSAFIPGFAGSWQPQLRSFLEAQQLLPASKHPEVIKLSDFRVSSSGNRCYTQPKYWFPADFHPADLFLSKESCSGPDYRPARKDVQTTW